MTDETTKAPEEFELLMEWPDRQGIVRASLGDNLEHFKAESQQAMNMTFTIIRSMAYRIARSIEDIQEKARPDEVEVEFSLKLDLEGGAIVPMVAKTTAGGQFNIKFKWALEKPKTASTQLSE